jgi:hypothetical protein
VILITQPRVGRSHNEILALQIAAETLGWKVIPAESSWRLPEDLIKSGELGVPYGSQLFCEVIAQQMNWELIKLPLNWLSTLPYQCVSRKIEFMTLKEAKQIKERKFIKPADDKCFDAKVYEAGEFIPSKWLEDDEPCLVSDVVQFDLEYRFFLSSKSYPPIKTWSAYMQFGNIVENYKFAQMIPAMPHNICDNPAKWLDNTIYSMLSFTMDKNQLTQNIPTVIDVGLIPGEGWAIIESNPIWASGLYYCDPISCLEAMKDSVRKR